MLGAKRVLLVEDDELLCVSLVEQFAAVRVYQTRDARSYAEGYKKGLDGIYEFILLDVSLPDGDGRVLCQTLRDAGVTCPILILTACDSDADTIAAFKAGADDYITKPFRFAVLMARVDAHLRRHGSSEEATYGIGPYTFRPRAKLLLDGNRRIRLTEKETDILKYLQRSGGTVRREVLLHELWGYNPAASTHTVETHIYRLRQKIEKDPYNAQLLQTETGGYRLNP